MRVITEECGLRVIALDSQDKPGIVEGSQYVVDAPQLHVELAFCDTLHDARLNPGLTEEACVQILLDRLVTTLLQREPCDAYRRALYHLVKARDCFSFHDRSAER